MWLGAISPAFYRVSTFVAGTFQYVCCAMAQVRKVGESMASTISNPPVEPALHISLSGYALLDTPMLNQGSAFSEDERRDLKLLGLLPFHPSTIDEQLARAYENYKRKDWTLSGTFFSAPPIEEMEEMAGRA